MSNADWWGPPLGQVQPQYQQYPQFDMQPICAVTLPKEEFRMPKMPKRISQKELKAKAEVFHNSKFVALMEIEEEVPSPAPAGETPPAPAGETHPVPEAAYKPRAKKKVKFTFLDDCMSSLVDDCKCRVGKCTAHVEFESLSKRDETGPKTLENLQQRRTRENCKPPGFSR